MDRQLEERLDDLIKNRCIDIIAGLVRKGGNDVSGFLIEKMVGTELAEVRDTIVLALAQAGCNEAVPHIVRLINRYCSTNCYSALVFALEDLDCAEYVCDILHIIRHGNFMSRRYMVDILKKSKEKLDEEQLEFIRRELEQYIADQEDRLEILQQAFEDMN